MGCRTAITLTTSCIKPCTTETLKPLSSLDLYAGSQLFEWIPNSSQSSSLITVPVESEVTMPSNISYNYFQIAAENLPLPTLQSITEYIIELFLRPEILTAILIAVTLLTVTAIIFKRRKKPPEIHMN